MASKLSSFKFGRGPSTSYNWDSWLDGSVTVLVRGSDDAVENETADFSCEAKSMELAARKAAKERDLKVRVKCGTASELLSPDEMKQLKINSGSVELVILQARPIPVEEGESDDKPDTVPMTQAS